jgi:hypothetical protein
MLLESYETSIHGVGGMQRFFNVTAGSAGLETINY